MYLQGQIGPAVPVFSKVTCILAFNEHSPVRIRVHKVCFQNTRGVLPLGQPLASAMVKQGIQYLSRLKPGSHSVKTSLLSCSQPILLSVPVSIMGQWCRWHDPRVTASSLLCFSVMRPRSRTKGAEGNNVELSAGGQTCLGNLVQQVLTLESSYSILIHLITKHWLWEWHLLLSNQRKFYSKHHKKAIFIWRSLCLQYAVTQLAWMR